MHGCVVFKSAMSIIYALIRKLLLHVENIETFVKRRREQEGNSATAFITKKDLIMFCLLHAEMRIGENLLTLMMQKMFELNSEEVQNRLKDRFEKRCARLFAGLAVKEICFKVYSNQGKVEHVQLCRKRICKVLTIWEELTEILFPEHLEIQYQWRSVGVQWREALLIIQTEKDLTDEQIIQFQNLIDNWVDTLTATAGYNNLGNYVHFFASGHVYELLMRFRNVQR
jgi:hypothetical protein